MEEEDTAEAAAGDDVIDQDLDMLVETSSNDEDDKASREGEYQNTAPFRSGRGTPIVGGIREQLPAASTSASVNADVDMATDSTLGSRFTSINHNDLEEAEATRARAGASRAASISSTRSAWDVINSDRPKNSAPRSDAAEEPEHGDNDVEMALNGHPEEYDEDNNRDHTQDQDQYADRAQGRDQDREQGLPGDDMDVAGEDIMEHEQHEGQAPARDQDEDWQKRANNHVDTDPHGLDAMDTTGTEEAATAPETLPGSGASIGTGTATPTLPTAGAATPNPESGTGRPSSAGGSLRSNEKDAGVNGDGNRSGSGSGHGDKMRESDGTLGGSLGGARGNGAGGGGSVNNGSGSAANGTSSGSGSGKMDVSHLLSGDDDDADGSK